MAGTHLYGLYNALLCHNPHRLNLFPSSQTILCLPGNLQVKKFDEGGMNIRGLIRFQTNVIDI
jgi:hypothetical protein